MELSVQINNHRKFWRIINMALIILGISTPWFKFYFDMQAPELGSPPIGWVFLLSKVQMVLTDLSENGFEILMLPFWLTSLSGFLIVLYLIFDFILLFINRDNRNKIFSVTLIGIVASLSFYVFLGGKPLLGYWLVNLGLISSIILEWPRQQS